MLKKISILAILALTIKVFALSQVWVHVNGIGQKVTMKPIWVKNGNLMVVNGEWIPNNSQYYVVACSVKNTHPIDNTWKKYSFSFMPENDGIVYLYLSGLWLKPKGASKNVPVWCAYDNLKVVGAEMNNCDFEEITESGELKNWRGETKDNIILNTEDAQSGKNYVIAWSGNQLEYALKVTKGQKVTVSFYAKTSNGPKGNDD